MPQLLLVFLLWRLAAGTPAPGAWVSHTVLQGHVTLALPPTWQAQRLGLGPRYHRDHAAFRHGPTGCSLERREGQGGGAPIQLPHERTALLAKNPGAEILTATVDPARQRASIAYRLAPTQRYCTYLIYAQATAQVRLAFQGPDTPGFRHTVAAVCRTLQLTP